LKKYAPSLPTGLYFAVMLNPSSRVFTVMMLLAIVITPYLLVA
jgi:hypothetical protein